MDYEGLIEKNVTHMMDKFFGDKDPALKTITKMNILYDGSDEYKNQMENVLSKMKYLNYVEGECIKKELSLTYDVAGNIVFVDDIDESKNTIFKESKNEDDSNFEPSNR